MRRDQFDLTLREARLLIHDVRDEGIPVEPFAAPPGAEATPKPRPRTGTPPLRPVTDPE